MFSILYSLWEASDHSSFLISMMLSLYTWASGLYAAIPDYAIVDFILANWTLFHLFVAVSIVTVADASYKRILVELHRSIAKTFYDIPFMVTGMTLGLSILTAKLWWQVYHNRHDSAATLRAVISINTWVCSIILQKLSISLIKLGVDYTLKQEREVERHDIIHWKLPAKWTRYIFEPLRWIIRPVVYGLENISATEPGFYVCNHGLLGMEMPHMIERPWSLKGVFIRGLADHVHFGHPHGEMIRYFGGVDGTRENVDTLMEHRQNVLVYPGGGHEVMKPCSVPKYTLMWKERLGFARLAIKHGYPIVPCCSVGTEDMMDRLFDVDLGFARKDLKCPVVFVPPHKLQRVYYWFGKPIPTAQYNGDWKNKDYCREVRDQVKAAVEAGIREMQEKQAKDPNRYLWDHLGNATNKAIATVADFCKDPFATTRAQPNDHTPTMKELDIMSTASEDEMVHSSTDYEIDDVQPAMKATTSGEGVPASTRTDCTDNDDENNNSFQWEPIPLSTKLAQLAAS